MNDIKQLKFELENVESKISQLKLNIFTYDPNLAFEMEKLFKEKERLEKEINKCGGQT